MHRRFPRGAVHVEFECLHLPLLCICLVVYRPNLNHACVGLIEAFIPRRQDTEPDEDDTIFKLLGFIISWLSDSFVVEAFRLRGNSSRRRRVQYCPSRVSSPREHRPNHFMACVIFLTTVRTVMRSTLTLRARSRAKIASDSLWSYCRASR